MANSKNPISFLQEIYASKRKPLPIYQEVISDSADYPFKCKVVVEDITAYGYARTKKEAKHNCAQEALLQLGVGSASAFRDTVGSPTVSERLNNITPNYVGALNEQASRNQVPYPVYCDQVPRQGLFVVECQFLNMTTDGVGSTKKDAKKQASKNMLEKLENNNIDFKNYQMVYNTEKDLNNDKVLKVYEKLSIANEEKEPTVSVPEIVLQKCEALDEQITLEELIAKLASRGHKCNHIVLQKKPYTVVLKIDGDSSAVLGQGTTLEEANNDLVSTCKRMIDDGFYFKSYF